jgi:hypothetical protein
MWLNCFLAMIKTLCSLIMWDDLILVFILWEWVASQTVLFQALLGHYLNLTVKSLANICH